MSARACDPGVVKDVVPPPLAVAGWSAVNRDLAMDRSDGGLDHGHGGLARGASNVPMPPSLHVPRPCDPSMLTHAKQLAAWPSHMRGAEWAVAAMPETRTEHWMPAFYVFLSLQTSLPLPTPSPGYLGMYLSTADRVRMDGCAAHSSPSTPEPMQGFSVQKNCASR